MRWLGVLDVPDVVGNKARAVGAAGWLRDLPTLVAELEMEWGIEVGAPYEDGTEAYVASALTYDGLPVVLKVLVPRDSGAAGHEITALRLAGGDGCVRLLRSDAARGAMLLEQLGPSMFRIGLPIERRHEILCDLAARMWRPAPDSGLPTGAAKGLWLIDNITTLWEALDRPCSERAVDDAVTCASRRIAAHDDERARLVHGDVHQWNALQVPGTADTYQLVDPDGLLAEPEYDLGILMREDPVELLAEADPRRRSRWLARRTGLYEQAVWEWGVVERVSTGLIGTQIGLQPSSRDMLRAADAVIRTGDR